MYAKDIMKRQVISVKPELLLKDAVDVLKKYQISGVPVTDESNRLVGVLSEKDFLTQNRQLSVSSYMELVTNMFDINKKEHLEITCEKLNWAMVKHVMSYPAFSVHEKATVEEVVSLMMNRHINRVPVVDEKNKIVGIIVRNDLLPLLING